MKDWLSQYFHRFSEPGQMVIKGSIALFFSRILMMLVPLIIVPFALAYLGVERYGLWMAITSLVLIFSSFADGGISNALVTATAKANEKDGFSEVRIVIGSAAAIVVPVSALFLLIAVIFVPLVPWDWVFSLPSIDMVNEVNTLVLIVISSVFFGFIVNIIIKTRHGLQQIIAVSIWDTLAVTAILPVFFLVLHLKLSMAWLVVAVVGTPLAIKALGSILFLINTRELVPAPSDISLARARDLLASGSVLLFITISHAVAIQSDQILIANLVGLEEVANYSVLQRLFALPWILVNFVLVAQWPAFSSAAARGEFDWIKKTFARTLVSAIVISTVLTGVLYILLGPILLAWVGEKITPSPLLALTMAINAVLIVVAGFCSTLLISLDVRRPQIWISIAMMVVNFPLSIFLIREIGAAGAVLGTIVSYLFCMLIPYAIIIPRIFRNSKNVA